MTDLVIKKDKPANLEETCFGGKPVKSEGESFEWPVCKCCNLPMQYQFRVTTKLGIEQIFMCQNDPGLCDDWDANSGGNAVIIVKASNLVTVNPPSEEYILSEAEDGALIESVNSENYEEARAEWFEKNKESPRPVLGKLNGQPYWLQSDETPSCVSCNEKMNFVGQFEEGPNSPGMNFGGGGIACLYDCEACTKGKFLWQC